MMISFLLQVKSVLDPCEDENDDNQDDVMSLGADSAEKDDGSSDSEVEYCSPCLNYFYKA